MSWGATLFGTPRELARGLAIATGLGMLLGVLGPFGSYNGGPLELRLFFWTGCLLAGFLLLSVAVRAALRLGARWDLPVWFALPAAVALASAPLCVLVNLFAFAVWTGLHGRLIPWLEAYGETLAVGEPAALLYYVLARSRAASTAPPVRPPEPVHSPVAPTEGRFEDRLSGRVGRDVLCLQMEDHYVRAHTTAGSELVLLPLKDAMAELQGRDGLQVHRSWWVARAAVAQPLRDGRNLRLKLVNGLEAPVSRTSLPLLREAGWLGEPAISEAP